MIKKRKNLVNLRFGRGVVQSYNNGKSEEKGRPYWDLKCDCETIYTVREDSLKNGHTKSCGCLNKEIMKRLGKQTLINIVGIRYGRGIVQSYNERVSKEKKKPHWNLLCDCGKMYVASGEHIKNGDTKSCGCLHLENLLGCNNCNYKGENCVTSLKKRVYRSLKYKKLRKARFELDNYTCQYSGETGIDINIHHIHPELAIWEEENITTYEEAMACDRLWDLSNVITIAEKYHLRSKKQPEAFHNIYGLKGFTEKDFEEWMKGEIC